MRKGRYLSALLLSAALLSACGEDRDSDNLQGSLRGQENIAVASEAEGNVGAGREIEITLWTFPVGNWGNPTTVGSLLTGFHRAHPDIHVSVEYLNYDDGDERIERAAGEGGLPDLIMEGPERLVANWGDKGMMVDISDLWESDTAGMIYENIKDACRHHNGSYYEFPVCMTAHCMAINYDMFREAGALPYIDEETHTWTAENFIKAVGALSDYGQEQAGVIYCENQSGDQGTRALINNLYGGTFTDEGHNFYTVDSEENRRALQMLFDLEGIVYDASMTAAEAIAAFCRGEAAMCFCWNGSIEIQQTINNPELDFEVFPMAFPAESGQPQLQGGIWGFGIFDSGEPERIEAAKTFIRYITEEDSVYRNAVISSSYWPVRDMGNIYVNDLLMTEYSLFMQYMGDYYQVTPGWAEARLAWCELLREVGGGANVEDALKNFSAAE